MNQVEKKIRRQESLKNRVHQMVLNEEADALRYEEEKDIEINMLRESMRPQIELRRNKENVVLKRQKYLNESNWHALRSYITKLAINQAHNLYDLKALKEELGVDAEQEIADEVEETLMTEIPLEIQGAMGTVIPIKIEVTPETADVLNTVMTIMDNNVGNDKMYLDQGQISNAADVAVEELPEEEENVIAANDAIADETIDIISKDQEVLEGIKAKMQELDLRVAGTERIIAGTADVPYEQPPMGTGTDVEERLVQDEETGLLMDPETGDIYDPETMEIIKEDFHREHQTKTILETLAFNKAKKNLNEDFRNYNRETAIIGGINSLIILETFNHVFGRKENYNEIKRKLNIR